MNRRRPLGLQGWLVAAFLAVGVVASLAVLLVLLPTLESNVRTDRAKLEAEQLAADIRRAIDANPLPGTPTEEDMQSYVRALRDATGADIRVIHTPVSALVRRQTIAQIPAGDEAGERLDQAGLLPNRYSADGRLVVFDIAFTSPADGARVLVQAALPLSGVSPELAIVRQRVVIAMVLVLVLASLAGVALGRLLGGRMRRLSRTAATIAGGDLSARAPELGTVPQELEILRDSLDGMAERLQSLVGAITDERDRDRAMVGSLAEGVLAVGPDGTVSVANDAANRLLGLPDLPEGAEPTRLDALPAAVMDAVLATHAPGGAQVEHRQVVLRDGTELELHAARISGHEGAGTVVTLRDVTDQRRLERARRDLVANVSHELKTPIAALKGFLELLEGERVSEEHRREFLASMSQETLRMERLVEEQLQLARLDAGALPLELADVDLGELAAAVVEARAPLAERDGIRLGILRHGAGTVVLADAARIEQVLLILLDNALRHTPAGGEVEVVVAVRGQAATMAVRDTGEGISREDQAFIFDRFYRGDPSREGRSAGLGLAIARGLVSAHRGQIEVRSELGVGTTFTVSLPLVSAGAVTQEAPIPPELRSR